MSALHHRVSPQNNNKAWRPNEQTNGVKKKIIPPKEQKTQRFYLSRLNKIKQ
jgi:hypothetical protein